MNPTPGKNGYLMQSLAQSNRRLTSTASMIKVEYPTPPPRTHSLGPMNCTPGQVEVNYPKLSLRAQSKQPMRSALGTVKVEYPIPPPRTHSLQQMTSIPGKADAPIQPTRTHSKQLAIPIKGKVASPSQPRIYSGSAMTMPIPQKAEYFPSKNDKHQDLNAAVEKASQEKLMATIATFCTKCNCRDYIGWCRDCKACFDCCPDFIDI
ncbi:hypothetical protein KI688_012019 [Linnemannia hyalina]|uniref:Uncharacterized protein n=1 Tax=Linnemannia hyalina TaxID=64524 RepID=A0A9P7XV97_9FUNG|nr:hypothetical protein KI688_012019 [Linnemannia hyalina]